MRPIPLLLAVLAILVTGCGGSGGGGGTPVSTHTLVFVDSGSFSADVWSMLSDGTAVVPRFTNASDDRQPWLHRDTGDVYYIKGRRTRPPCAPCS